MSADPPSPARHPVNNSDRDHSLERVCGVPLQRNLTFTCAESTYFPVYFNWSSFLRLPGQRDSDTLSVSLSFRTWNPNGVLMFTQLAEGWLELGLMEGKVTVYINVTQKRSTRVDISSGESTFPGAARTGTPPVTMETSILLYLMIKPHRARNIPHNPLQDWF